MKRVMATVGSFDLFSVPVEIRSEEERKVRSMFSSLVSVLILLIVLYYFAALLIEVINQEVLTTTSFREFTASDITFSGVLPMFGVSFDNLPFDKFKTMFDSEVSVRNDHTGEVLESFQLQPCTPKHWSMVSLAEYEAYQKDNYLCPSKGNFSLAWKKVIKRTSMVRVAIRTCNSNGNADCDRKKVEEYIDSNDIKYNLQVMLLDCNVEEKQKSPYKIKIEGYKLSSNQYSYKREVNANFMQISIQTDYSIFPWKNIKREDAIQLRDFTSSAEEVMIDQFGDLLAINFAMSDKLLTYSRTVGKIHEVVSLAGGLYSSIFAVLGIIIWKYNSHKLSLRLAENTFKEGPNSITRSQYGFFNSLKFALYSLLRPAAGKDIEWKQCQNTRVNVKEINSLTQIEPLLRRIYVLEEAIKHVTNKNEFACLSMFQTLSLERAKHERTKFEYFNLVTRKRNITTIKEIRKAYDGAGIRLDQFYHSKMKILAIFHFAKPESKVEKRGKPRRKFGRVKQRRGSQITSSVETEKDLELKQRSKSNQFRMRFSKSKSDLNVLEDFIDLFEDIKQQAESIRLTPQYVKMETKLAKAFYNLSQAARAQLQENIPIIILYRFMMSIRWIKEEEDSKNVSGSNGGKKNSPVDSEQINSSETLIAKNDMKEQKMNMNMEGQGTTKQLHKANSLEMGKGQADQPGKQNGRNDQAKDRHIYAVDLSDWSSDDQQI